MPEAMLSAESPPLRSCKAGNEAAVAGFLQGRFAYSDWAFMYERRMALMRVW
jgi:hypothetical protein